MPTEHQFEIKTTKRHHNRGQFIFAKLLSGGLPLYVKDGSLLGGVPVYHYREMYPLNDKENNPRLEIFVFCPMEMVPYTSELFKDGELVVLVIEDQEML